MAPLDDPLFKSNGEDLARRECRLFAVSIESRSSGGGLCRKVYNM